MQGLNKYATFNVILLMQLTNPILPWVLQKYDRLLCISEKDFINDPYLYM